MIFAVRQVLTTGALGLCLGASGCQLDLNAELTKNNNSNGPDGNTSGLDAGGPPTCPPGFICTPAPLDAGTSGFDGGSLPSSFDDGSLPRYTDAGRPPIEDSGVPCLQDSDCAPDSYCSVKKVCRANCEAARGCVLPHSGPTDVLSMLSAEGTLLWTSKTTFNELQNSLHSGAIWRITEDGTSTAVISGLERPSLVRVVDGVIYFFNNILDGNLAEPLLAAPLSGGTVTPVLVNGGPVQNVVSSASYLWWTRPTKGTAEAPTVELWRRPRHGSPTDEHVKDLPGWALWAATDTAVAYAGSDGQWSISRTGPLMLDNLNGAPPIEIDEPGLWNGAVLTDHSLVACAQNYMKRYGLSGQGDGENVARPSESLVVMETHAPWILWASEQTSPLIRPNPADPRIVHFGRTQIDGTSEPQTLFKVTYPSDYNNPNPSPVAVWFQGLFALAPWGDELVYQLSDELRLARVRIPAFPCSSSLPCREGSVCQPDQTCR